MHPLMLVVILVGVFIACFVLVNVTANKAEIEGRDHPKWLRIPIAAALVCVFAVGWVFVNLFSPVLDDYIGDVIARTVSFTDVSTDPDPFTGTKQSACDEFGPAAEGEFVFICEDHHG